MGDLSGIGTALLLLLALVTFLIWFIRVLTSHRAPEPPVDIAKAVLDAEFARGHISRAEYEERSRRLRER